MGRRHEYRVEPKRFNSIDTVLRKGFRAVVARRIRRDDGISDTAHLIEQDLLVLRPLTALLELLENFHRWTISSHHASRKSGFRFSTNAAMPSSASAVRCVLPRRHPRCGRS